MLREPSFAPWDEGEVQSEQKPKRYQSSQLQDRLGKAVPKLVVKLELLSKQPPRFMRLQERSRSHKSIAVRAPNSLDLGTLKKRLTDLPLLSRERINTIAYGDQGNSSSRNTSDSIIKRCSLKNVEIFPKLKQTQIKPQPIRFKQSNHFLDRVLSRHQ